VTLRRRLWLVLGGLFLVPLAVGALVLLLVVPDARSEQVSADVDGAAVAVRAELTDECRSLGLAARMAALESVVDAPDKAVGNLVGPGYVDFATVLDGSGAEVATAGALPADSGPPDQLRQCSTQRPAGGGTVLAERVVIADEQHPGRVVVVAKRLDRELLDDVRERSGAGGDVVLLDGNEVVLSTLERGTTRQLVRETDGRTGRVTLPGWVARVDPPGRDIPWTLVVTAPDPADTSRTGLFLLILLVAALVAGLLVTLVARGLSQPYTDIADAAERVARGDLDTDITPATDREAGRLGSAFNQMTGELRRSMAALERSREDLRDSLERIGDTLTSTHDLDGLLQVVLETAVVTLQGRAGVVLHMSADRLQLVGEHGLHDAGLPAPAAVSPGTGVLGRVVSGGEAVRGRLGSGPLELEPIATEPGRGDVLAVPIRSMGTVIGVLALYDRLDGRPFEPADEDALRTLAGQASIAVDNVQLHHEAQRLSTTDPLTGLWNFRYLSMSLAREIERSTRFDRPLAVLMLDLDHFKLVNDEHGHARGDSVLWELAHRVQEQIREVDTFARYGGEEFVVVLPETTVEGAAQLADRICQAVRRDPFVVEGEPPLDITVSVGGAAFPDQGSTPATLMRSADRALYVAKGEGRDRWHLPGAPDEVAPGR
jgi:two-component system, cell cycle response regulator